MNIKQFTVLAIISIFIGALIGFQAVQSNAVYAQAEPTDDCQRQGDCRDDPQPTHGNDCVPPNEDHCGGSDEPTEIPPTAIPPTEIPEPTATLEPPPTSTPEDPTATPDPEVTPTNDPPTPTEEEGDCGEDGICPQELPNTGDPLEWSSKAWNEPGFSDTTYFVHNGNGGFGDKLIQLHRGSVFYYGMARYEVLGSIRLLPSDVDTVSGLEENHVLFITCSGYVVSGPDAGTWRYRIVVIMRELGPNDE